MIDGIPGRRLLLFSFLSACEVAELRVIEGDPSLPADECSLPCFSIQTPDSAAVSVELESGAVILGVKPDENGVAEICPLPGSVPPLNRLLRVSQGDSKLEIDLDVRPFGWGIGLDKSRESVATLARTPELVLPPEPLFEPVAGTWYQYQLAHPFIYGDILAFGGTDEFVSTDEAHNPYQLGLATITDGVVTDVIGPLFPDGGWGEAARNAPELFYDGTIWTMWFHSQESAGPAVGRATSTDGRNWALDPNNPVFPNTENAGASHATVIEHDAGVLEMWFAGLGGIGSALSADNGASFVPYCANPVLPADMDGGYKAPAVAWDGERYLLAATQGDKGTYAVIWAESFDGLRWTRSDHPVLDFGASDWNNHGVESGQILLDGDDVRLLVVANGGGDPGNGIAIAAE